MRWMSAIAAWFREKRRRTDQVSLVGHDVHVTANPTRAAIRNEARMARLRLAIAQSSSPKKRAALQEELTQREMRSS